MRNTAAIQLDIPKLRQAIEKERCRRKLKHFQVAAELGISETTVSTWRRGTSMSGDVALRVVTWLRADLRDFARPPAALDPATKGQAA